MSCGDADQIVRGGGGFVKSIVAIVSASEGFDGVSTGWCGTSTVGSGTDFDGRPFLFLEASAV